MPEESTDRRVRMAPSEFADRFGAVFGPSAPARPASHSSNSSSGTDVAAIQVGRDVISASEMLQQIQAKFTSMVDQLDAMNWSGVPLDHLQQSRQHLARASEHASTAAASIIQGVTRVGDAYTANAQVGTKESVLDR